MCRRCLNPYEAHWYSFSTDTARCPRLSCDRSDGVGLRTQPHGRIDGDGLDMGAPFWPYQAIYLLLFTVNAPAFVLSMPILRLLNLHTLSLQYGVWFPAIVGWWWWVGAGSSRVDAVCRAVNEGHIHRISRHPGEPEEQSGLRE